jgi:hypothetical protein
MKPADYWKQVRDVCDKATRGPWSDEEYPDIISSDGCWSVLNSEMGFVLANDAAFIALARTALPEALDEIDSLRAGQQNDDRDHRRLTAEIERLRTALERAVDLLIIVPRDTDDEDKIDEVATVIHAALSKP